MTERIKELAKQARQIGEYVNYGQIRLSPAQFEQKFAELIIQECIPFVGDKDSQRVHDMLKHFGVKE